MIDKADGPGGSALIGSLGVAATQCDDCHAPAGTVCADMDCPGKRAKRGKLEHVPFANCWCEPTPGYTDPCTGATVWVHREPH